MRCSQEEADEAGLSCVEKEGVRFCLVEAEVHQLRIGVAGEFMRLQVDHRELLRLGVAMLESEEDLNYATASDPGRTASKDKPKKKKKRKEETSSEDSSEEGEGLDSLRKRWLDFGLEEDKKRREASPSPFTKRKSKRFSMIEGQKEEKASGSASKEATESMVQAAMKTGDPLQGLLALQLAQSLKQSRKSKASRRSHSPSSQSEDQTTSSEEGRKGERGHARAVLNYKKSRKRMFKNPVKNVRKFVKDMEEELGAQDRPFRIVDYNKKIPFGKQRNLQRCHYLVSIILELLRRNRRRSNVY